MSDSDTIEDVEAPFSVSFKTSPGFEAAQLTVRGNNADELLARLNDLNEAGGMQEVVDFNNLLQAANRASAPEEPEEEKEEKKSSGRGRGSSRGGNSRGGSSGGNRGGSRGSSRGNDRQSRSEIDEDDLHPEGLTCDKRGCDGRVHYKKIENNRGTYELWVCEYQRSKGDGHFSEFIND